MPFSGAASRVDAFSNFAAGLLVCVGRRFRDGNGRQVRGLCSRGGMSVRLLLGLCGLPGGWLSLSRLPRLFGGAQTGLP